MSDVLDIPSWDDLVEVDENHVIETIDEWEDID